MARERTKWTWPEMFHVIAVVAGGAALAIGFAFLLPILLTFLLIYWLCSHSDTDTDTDDATPASEPDLDQSSPSSSSHRKQIQRVERASSRVGKTSAHADSTPTQRTPLLPNQPRDVLQDCGSNYPAINTALIDLQNDSPGIYYVRNLYRQTTYVGESIHHQTRWEQHRANLAEGRHHNYKLQDDFRKYGLDGFEFVLVEPIALPSGWSFRQAKELLWSREIYHIKMLKNQGAELYNLTDGGGSLVDIEGYLHDATDVASRNRTLDLWNRTLVNAAKVSSLPLAEAIAEVGKHEASPTVTAERDATEPDDSGNAQQHFAYIGVAPSPMRNESRQHLLNMLTLLETYEEQRDRENASFLYTDPLLSFFCRPFAPSTATKQSIQDGYEALRRISNSRHPEAIEVLRLAASVLSPPISSKGSQEKKDAGDEFDSD